MVITPKRILAIALLVISCWLGMLASGSAQVSDTRLESRIRTLESEMTQVRSQLSRLQTQMSGSRTPLPATPPPPVPGLNEPSLAEQFDNLATLAIELKLRVRQLEERVDQLSEETSM